MNRAQSRFFGKQGTRRFCLVSRRRAGNRRGVVPESLWASCEQEQSPGSNKTTLRTRNVRPELAINNAGMCSGLRVFVHVRRCWGNYWNSSKTDGPYWKSNAKGLAGWALSSTVQPGCTVLYCTEVLFVPRDGCTQDLSRKTDMLGLG
jgi:hypothetical protein